MAEHYDSEHRHRVDRRLIQHVAPNYTAPSNDAARLVGVLEGEGIGSEVVGASLDVLSAVAEATGVQFDVVRGGAIGKAAEKETGHALPEKISSFCEDVFAAGGAILSGPGGSRYVYDLRRRFDLYCKVVPIRTELKDARWFKSDHTPDDVDLVLIRENTGGIYQGRWTLTESEEGRTAGHAFDYSERQVKRILEVAALVAKDRQRRITVVWKEAGIPSVSQLWRECTAEVAEEHGIAWEMIDVDFASYSLLVESTRFDVIVAPNLFGDVLGDVSAILSGSRGLTFSGNFNASGHSVYQTNHGAAFDLQGSNRANPVGQILSLAMMLRESFDLGAEASLVERSICDVWTAGWRTFDIAAEGCRLVGTSEMGKLISDRIAASHVEMTDR